MPLQLVDVHVNSEKLASWEVGAEDVFTLSVPRRFVAAPGVPRPFVLEPGTRLLIEFTIPRAISPEEAGQSGDRRRLGLRLGELTISNEPPFGAAPAANPERGQKS